MKSNNGPDSLPASLGYDDVPADEAFVHEVMACVERHRRRRRVMVGLAGGLAVAIACMLLAVLPAIATRPAPVSVFDISAALILVGLCGMA